MAKTIINGRVVETDNKGNVVSSKPAVGAATTRGVYRNPFTAAFKINTSKKPKKKPNTFSYTGPTTSVRPGGSYTIEPGGIINENPPKEQDNKYPQKPSQNTPYKKEGMAILKLAQARLAINYVLRNRMMNKQVMEEN